MFKQKISEEEMILQRAQARAERDKKRLQKLKNQRQWNTGFYTQDIDSQIKDLEIRKQQQKENSLTQDEIMVNAAKASLQNEKELLLQKRKENREYAKELLSVNACERDTYDLIDPKILSKTNPPRVRDNEFIHVSSLQKFDGEDLSYNQKHQNQQQILRENLENQIKHKQLEKEEENKNIQAYVEQRNYANKVWGDKENQKAEIAKKSEQKTAEINKKLSAEKHQLTKKQEEENDLNNKNQKEYLKNSDFLTENFDSTIRSNCPHRFINYNFKGFSTEVSKEFYNNRIEQINAKKENHIKEAHAEKNWADTMEKQRKEKLRLEVAEQKSRNQKRKEYAAELLKQTEKQKKMQKQTEKLYSNEITDGFWSQFGTSHR